MSGLPRVLLTGATGFLGSHFAAATLRDGSANLVCVARSSTNRSARHRVEAAILDAGHGLSPAEALADTMADRLHVVEGDLTSPGWEDHPLLSTDPIDACWHLAGEVCLDDRQAARILATNVEGGRRLLDWLVRHAVPELNLVSTAYVAGAVSGVVRERAVDPSTPANNIYESSKRKLEAAVLREFDAGSISGRIFRPTILLGHSQTGRPDPGLGGVYGFLARLHRVARGLPRQVSPVPITLVTEPLPTLSLLPVDQAVAMMAGVAAAPSSREGIYHIGPSEPTDVAWMLRIAGPYLKVEFHFAEDAATLDPVSRAVHRHTLPWQPYLRRYKHFAISRTRAFLPGRAGPAGIDATTMHRLMRVFAEAREPCHATARS